MTRFVPSKVVSARYKSPWITRDIKRLIRRKQRAYNRAKSSDKESDWNYFRHLRKKTQTCMKEAHSNYLNDLFNDNNNKGLWRYLKATRQNSCGVSTLVQDGQSAATAQQKANMLNKQFSSVFTREDAQLPPTQPTTHPIMSPITIAEPGVHKLLRQLDTKKACGSDGIPAIFLKICADELSPMLTDIIQQTLDSHCIPSDWKEALITPVFKKGNRAKPEN